MRQRLGLIITIILVVGVLVLINSLTYVNDEKQPDSELVPNRSTYHAGPTGTRALYDLLNESGYSVMRWRDTADKLLSSNQKVRTFVIVGNTRISIKEDEAKSILLWVENGGRLVLVDRHPEASLLPASGDWQVRTEFTNFPPLDVKPGNTEDMTSGVQSVRPVQPTLLTSNVDEVMPSRFASLIDLSTKQAKKSGDKGKAVLGFDDDEEPPTENVNSEEKTGEQQQAVSPAPVVHLGEQHTALLVDYPHGLGRITLLSDPYIVSNGGISLRDNVKLALNMLTSEPGLIAFDEFHQGRGITRNPIVSYFSGTPILAFGGQIVLLILLVLWTRGRRFGRSLPLPQVDRRSTLEFVASMAEVQQRARAFDLAIENVYTRTRRVLARYAGVDYNTSRSEIANRVAMRSAIDARQLEVLMRQCEEAINGQEISERQSVYLVRRLREIEASLGLRMRSRDIKQAAQKI